MASTSCAPCISCLSPQLSHSLPKALPRSSSVSPLSSLANRKTRAPIGSTSANEPRTSARREPSTSLMSCVMSRADGCDSERKSCGIMSSILPSSRVEHSAVTASMRSDWLRPTIVSSAAAPSERIVLSMAFMRSLPVKSLVALATFMPGGGG
eukprot:scaffold12311_cov56-Phaeocystis_antarctica.AAC.1